MRVSGELGFVRMNSRGSVNPIMRFGERNRRGQMIGSRGPANRQNRFNARIARPLQHSVAILIELWVFQMRVRINYFQSQVQVAPASLPASDDYKSSYGPRCRADRSPQPTPIYRVLHAAQARNPSQLSRS